MLVRFRPLLSPQTAIIVKPNTANATVILGFLCNIISPSDRFFLYTKHYDDIHFIGGLQVKSNLKGDNIGIKYKRQTSARENQMQKEAGFADRLAELMAEHALTTVSLGAALGVSDETVRRWRKGERSILLPQLVRLADYFHCSLDFLAGRTETYLDYRPQAMPPFFDQLRAVMAEKGATRYALVKALPIYDSYFTNWKHGKSPNLLTLILLADYLDVTVDHLVGRDR